MSFRKEKKYRLSLSEQKILKSQLLKNGMKHLHPKRIINSIYFDTRNLDFHLNSEEGVLPRKKIRIRWYNNNISQSQLETKVSSVEGRFKTSKPFKKNILLNKRNLQITDKNYGILKPKVLISYKREYFLFENIRLTFDTDIKYENLQSINNCIMIERECVMEVKSNYKTGDDYILKLVNYPTSRFSKYSRGIIHLNNINRL